MRGVQTTDFDHFIELAPEANTFQRGYTIDDIDLDWELFNLLLEKETKGIDSQAVTDLMNDTELWNAFEGQFTISSPPVAAEPQPAYVPPAALPQEPVRSNSEHKSAIIDRSDKQGGSSDSAEDSPPALRTADYSPTVIEEIIPQPQAEVSPHPEVSQEPFGMSRRRMLGLIGKAAGLSVVAYAGIALQPIEGTASSEPTRLSTPVTEASTPASTSSTTPPTMTQPEAPTTTTAPEIPMAAEPLHIEPKPHFLTPEGALVAHDYLLVLPTIGSRILGFERPEEEATRVGDAVNATAIDTLTAAQQPQALTPQVAAYAAANPSFVPTLERRGKGYWKGASAGTFQKTAMHPSASSVYPGQRGNAFVLAHGSTKNAGGGDLPALKVGDPLQLTRTIDGNTYTFVLAESEVIRVNQGQLTDEEKARQIAKGHRSEVSAGEVAYRYLGHEDQATLTIQICSDRDGTPGGGNGQSAAEARILYRFVLQSQDIKMRYPVAN